MPLPTRPGHGLMHSELRPREISDPGFLPAVEEYVDEQGNPRKREKEGYAKVYLRPLLSIEIDKADAEAQEFVARYITGGFIHPTTNQYKEEPDPILVDGKKVEIEVRTAVKMHRYEAMQKPMRGTAPADQDFVKVDDMVRATVMHDLFWRGLEAFADEVWREGQTGKAWAPPQGSTPPAES